MKSQPKIRKTNCTIRSDMLFLEKRKTHNINKKTTGNYVKKVKIYNKKETR